MSMADALQHCVTTTSVPFLGEPYRGKVRDVYVLGSDKLGIIVTDRISAFDFIMRQAIPFKGQILNQLAAFSLRHVEDIIPTHLLDVPHPNVTIAKKCQPFAVEVVVRGYLTGHAWRTYKAGGRQLCGVALPEGLREHDAFPEPILTPATKAMEGHDEDISESELLNRGIVSGNHWDQIRETAFELFRRGSEMARKQGLILVDTKYEFGLWNEQITLIDEVHTADSSRYFYLEGYEQRQEKGTLQKQLSKEFLREWLMAQHFQGLEGQTLPDLPDEFRVEVYERYREVYERLTGSTFTPTPTENFSEKLSELLAPFA